MQVPLVDLQHAFNSTAFESLQAVGLDTMQGLDEGHMAKPTFMALTLLGKAAGTLI